ncbi:chromate transporter [Mycoplasma procyoni]|nr:chromate transporter [Mycoplasma procyoni]
MLAILVSLLSVFIIGLIVFGGGQVFMPIFSSFWSFISDTFNLNITQEKIDLVFTISNSTPGVVSTKFAAFTGILVSNGAWWGWIVSLFSYLVFCLPSIFMMLLSIKLISKSKQNKYLANMMKFINPVVAGILISLAIQLLISTIFVQMQFNSSFGNYISFKNTEKSQFFSGWRFIALCIWVPVFAVFSFIYYYKKKPLYYLFIGGIISAFIIFEPWL